jgi:cation transport regulator ChaB
MQYKNLDELPDSVVLSKNAREIYPAAYDNAQEQFVDL